MKSRSEEFEEWGTEVIFGRAKGFRAAMMRMILRGASWLFHGLSPPQTGSFLYIRPKTSYNGDNPS